jgi:3-deoxy-D-manno-octulosonic-acid transferase
MILFLYNLALVLVLVLGAPWWLFRMATTQKYREGLLERLGFVQPALVHSLKGLAGRQVIWVHAVSVGEVLAVSRLIAELDAGLSEYFTVISTTTRTGQVLARERFGADRVFYCPLDLPWAVRAYLNLLKPRLLVLAETEFWPNLLSGSFRREIPVVVANARISDRSWPRYRRLRGLWRPFLSRLTRVLAQTLTDANRLKSLGCLPERVTVSGNLKFDVTAGKEAEATRILRQLAGELRLIVAGSTLEGEESALLAAWSKLLKTDNTLAMVIAPRHPERFGAVAELLRDSGFRWRKRSEIGDSKLAPGEIVLLDSIGELASVYSLASVAFVGGSLVPAGGHNPLEPAQFGVPVMMGDHYENFQGIMSAMIDDEAITVVHPTKFADALADLLKNKSATSAMGERGRNAFEKQAGATARTVAVIRGILDLRGEA